MTKKVLFTTRDGCAVPPLAVSYLASAAWANATASSPSPYNWCTWEVTLRCKIMPDENHPNIRSRSARFPFSQNSALDYVDLIEFLSEACMICLLADGTLDQFIERYAGYTPRDRSDILADHRALFRSYKKVYYGMLKVLGDELLSTIAGYNRKELTTWAEYNFASVTPPMFIVPHVVI